MSSEEKEGSKHQGNIDLAFQSIEKCALAFYVLCGILLAFAVIFWAAAYEFLAISNFHFLEYVKDTIVPKRHSAGLFWVGVLIGFFAAILFSINLLVNDRLMARQGYIKNEKAQTTHQFIVYIIVTAGIIILSCAVDTYSGIFSAIPFVVFAIGATQTQRMRFFLITVVIHFILLFVMTHAMDWGVNWKSLRALLNLEDESVGTEAAKAANQEKGFLMTVTVSYLSITFAKLVDANSSRLTKGVRIMAYNRNPSTIGVPVADAADAINKEDEDN